MEKQETGRIEFVKIPYSVFTDQSLTATEKLAMGRLLLYAGKNGMCYPSHETLARELCLKPRQVRNLLGSLKQKGWLDWRRTGKSNAYVLCTADGQWIADQSGNGLPIRSAMDCLQKEVLKDQVKEKDLDCSTASSAPPSKMKQYPILERFLHMYFQEPPSGRTVVDVMDAAGGASEAEVAECLKHLYVRRGLEPGTEHGPKSWAWFAPVVRDYFNRKQAQEDSAHPTGYHEWAERNATRLGRLA